MAGKSLYSLIFFLGANTRDFQSGLQRAQSDFARSIKGMQAMGNMMGAIVGSAVAGSIISLAQASIQAIDGQLKSEAKLLTALKGRQDVMRRLSSEAGAMQLKLNIPDDVIISSQALLASYKFTEKQITDLIPLIADFATIQGMQLDEATNTVAKSIAGQRNTLKNYGIEIDKTASKSEQFAQVMTQLNDKFGGQAEAAAKTGAAQIEKFGLLLDELKENIGREILPFLSAVFGKINEILGAATETKTTGIEKFKADYIKMSAEAQKAELDGYRKQYDEYKRLWKQAIDSNDNESRKHYALQLDYTSEYISAMQTINKEQANNNKIKSIGNEEIKVTVGIINILNEKIKANAEAQDGATSENTIRWHRQLGEQLKAELEYYQKIGTALEKIKQKGLPSSLPVQSAKDLPAPVPRNSGVAPAMPETEPTGGEGGGFGFQLFKPFNYTAELDNLKKALDEGKISYEDYYSSIEELEIRKNVAIVDGVTNMLSNTQALFKENSQEYKILASAQALIQTYVNATQAYGALASIPVVGPALGFVAAAAAVAFGLQNVAKINSVGMATGGIVPPGYPNDTYPARLTSGEMVVPPKSIDSFLGNAMPSTIRLVGVISGRDIRISNERDQYFKQRTTGR